MEISKYNDDFILNGEIMVKYIETSTSCVFQYDSKEEMEWHVEHLKINFEDEFVLTNLYEQQLSSVYNKLNSTDGEEVNEVRQKIYNIMLSK
ncbi:hypothetical protein D3C73_510010 [compost metagenome]